jgi:hypothetical protein
MRNRTSACALFFTLMAASAFAQAQEAPAPSADTQVVPPPAWAYNDLACAPGLLTEKRNKTNEPQLRVIGVQDPAIRDLFGPGDTLVISGGSNAGLEPGQRFFVRRIIPQVSVLGPAPPSTVHTSGWVQVLGVDTMVATALVVHACEAIMFDDYLEPFVAPAIAARPLPGTSPQYENMGHIVSGVEGLYNAAPGNVMTIDRGSNAGVTLGQRYLVFRDKRTQHMDITGKSKVFADMAKNTPLVEVGEVLVVAVRANDATVQVVAARDAVMNGDLIAPIR